MNGYIKIIAIITPSNKLRITVKDTGVGIPTDKVQYLFREFSMISEHSSINPSGCGLGLHIANRLALELGGKQIYLKSQVGKGSKFSFCIPIFQEVTSSVTYFDLDENLEYLTQAKNEMPAAIPRTFAINPSFLSNRGKQVLIADDNEFNLMVLTALLDEMRVEFDTASNGQEVIDQVLKQKEKGQSYSLLILDVDMPVMTGWEASSKIRSFISKGELPNSIRIIAYTGYTSEEEILRCYNSGMDDYIQKPVSSILFKNLVRKYLNL